MIVDLKRLQTLLFVLCIISLQCKRNNSNGPVSISIKALDGLKFDKVRFNVKPGSKVSLTFENVSDMPHNMVITSPGAREKVVSAGLQLEGKGPEMNFIPAMDEVLWSIPVLSPGQSKSINFVAPSETGVYPYVCTYPGHGFTMFGEMHVTMDEDSAQEEKNDSAANKPKISENPHPYPLTPPYLYHVFIDGATPASIAVALPNQISYCWDAGTCSLRFAWKGDFLDMSDIWEGHFDASAKILGDIFFTDNTAFPIRLNPGSNPGVKYKGYRLVDRYPEFHYQVDGVDVYELITSKADSLGLVREFRIPNANKPVWYYVNADDAMKYEFSAGAFDKNKLKLSAAEAKKFTVTMTSYHLAYKMKD
ncbi:MAG: hypothetical protein JNK79_03115 [Chitinophagaceae bacterium]|nr:hypothetical protein [Chitinophagaceae bacterium]